MQFFWNKPSVAFTLQFPGRRKTLFPRVKPDSSPTPRKRLQPSESQIKWTGSHPTKIPLGNGSREGRSNIVARCGPGSVAAWHYLEPPWYEKLCYSGSLTSGNIHRSQSLKLVCDRPKEGSKEQEG